MLNSLLSRGLAAALLLSPVPAMADDVLVFAAASLKNAIEEIVGTFNGETGHNVTVSLAGSSALARQIQSGAPADLFISANVGWMDTLEEDGLIAPGTRADLLANALVLIAADPQAEPVELSPGVDLAGLLGGGHLAMALVDAVPAGIYGKAALEGLGIWQAVAPQVAQSDNVRAALALVATGEAPYGIVYATDAVAEPGVQVVGTFPADSHPPIIYPAAILAGHEGAAAEAFLAYLSGATARASFEAQGFVVLGEE
ncbi:molybdate ABC transporter substrate-binding protein [Sinisalibacter aestuarii]|uniref:Molybdate ABC transporter substrate-binding protein n=1 Tax=Sinisalibacter aestuarii TaxID=2949426 RepID=A0ABQ5LVS7_9RHOB|nr:molybdate ABC transporter substrate-binding protein [Sinisalibacter aestuarii]GKY89093.1 molybdate ABC transporter substrate-binding protein [Sinisalibacter aestuarii]